MVTLRSKGGKELMPLAFRHHLYLCNDFFCLLVYSFGIKLPTKQQAILVAEAAPLNLIL